jgi:hypothetical protein
MMATTHALAGMILAGVVSLLAPEATPVVLAAGAAGGVFPDLDLYAGHRRTLHFPVYYAVAGAATLGLAFAAPEAATVALAAFLLAAALHAGMDALGGGLELRPWEGRSERAVYSHYHGRWLRPRRWVRYDGAPEDALLAGALGAPLVLVGGEVGALALALVAVSAGYALVRKRLAGLWVAVVRALPGGVASRLPERFAEERTG